MENFSHLLEIDEDERRLLIYRVNSKDQRHLYTSIDLPPTNFGKDKKAFREFARKLGENLLIDSPSARRLLGL